MVVTINQLLWCNIQADWNLQEQPCFHKHNKITVSMIKESPSEHLDKPLFVPLGFKKITLLLLVEESQINATYSNLFNHLGNFDKLQNSGV